MLTPISFTEISSNSFFHFSVAKPLFVDGSAKSHEMFLAYDKTSLAKLEPPLVLQEFVNHGIHVLEN